MAAPAKKLDRFAKDEVVLAFHGPCLYMAKVMEVDEKGDETKEGNESVKYYVHYHKWAKRWDEWVGAERLLKDTKENRAYAEELLKKAKKSGAAAAAPAAADEPAGKKGKRKATEEKAGKKGKKQKTDADLEEGVEGEDALDKKEVKLKIPGQLKKQLFEDWKRVTKEGKLVPLPRDVTVTKILDEFVKSKKTKNAVQENLVKEIVEGCRQFFERSLGKLLLYRFERLQYARLSDMADTKGKNVCDIYGAEHLLRLFVKMPSLLSHTQLTAKEATILAAKLLEVISFLKRKQSQYFVSEYLAADSEYVKLSGAAAQAAEAANPAPAAAAAPAPAAASASSAAAK